MLDLMAGSLPELLAGFTQTLDEKGDAAKTGPYRPGLRTIIHDRVEAMRERTAYLASEPDIGPMLRTLLRLRHDIVMIGRAAVRAAIPNPCKHGLGLRSPAPLDRGGLFAREQRALIARRKRRA